MRPGLVTVLIGILCVSSITLVEARSSQEFTFCSQRDCGDEEESCAIDRTNCMVAFKAYLDCVKSDSVCTGLASTDSYGECWTKCRQSTTSSLYTSLQSCYESCGAAEHSSLLATISLTVLLLVFASL